MKQKYYYIFRLERFFATLFFFRIMTVVYGGVFMCLLTYNRARNETNRIYTYIYAKIDECVCGDFFLTTYAGQFSVFVDLPILSFA